jgi:colanic acid biosynthesis glycosyl transferase WcaI
MARNTPGSRLRILIQGVDYAPWSTGVPKYTAELGAWLAARGHEVEAVAGLPYYPEWRVHPAYRGARFHREILDGVTVLRVPLRLPRGPQVGPRDRVWLETSFGLAAWRYWLPRLVAAATPDVVIAVCPPMQAALHPALHRWVRSVPWVLHVQDLQLDAALALGLLRGRLLETVLRAVERRLLRSASAVSTISEPMRRRILDKGVPGDRVWVVPNWADLRHVRPLPRVNSFRRSLGIGDEAVLLMHAGAVGEKHGLELVIEAAARLRGREDLHFAIVGAGSAAGRLREATRTMGLGNVIFAPVQPVDRLPALLAAADIHLVVQRRVAADRVMPSKLANILAAGRPAIATAGPGTAVHDLVAGQRLGRVCEPEDAEALVRAIEALAASPSERAELGRRARLHAERFLDRDRILEGFVGQLTGLIRREPGARLGVRAGQECRG